MDSKNNILEASKKVRIDLRNGYIDFMNKRFPETKYTTVLSYALEWADRFNSGNVLGYCDKESKVIIKKIFNY